MERVKKMITVEIISIIKDSEYCSEIYFDAIVYAYIYS